jgi:hypothetical protein
MHVSTAISRHAAAAPVDGAASVAASPPPPSPISQPPSTGSSSAKDAVPRATRAPLRKWMLPLLVFLVLTVIALSIFVHARGLSVGKKTIKKGGRRVLRTPGGSLDEGPRRPPPVFNDLGTLESVGGAVGGGGLLLDAAAASDVAKAGASIDASLMVSGPMAGGFGGDTGVGQEVDLEPVQQQPVAAPEQPAGGPGGADAGAVAVVPASPTSGELPALTVSWGVSSSGGGGGAAAAAAAGPASATLLPAVLPPWAHAGRALLDTLAAGGIALGASSSSVGVRHAVDSGGSGPSLAARLLVVSTAAAAAAAAKRHGSGGAAPPPPPPRAVLPPVTNLLYPGGRVRRRRRGTCCRRRRRSTCSCRWRRMLAAGASPLPSAPSPLPIPTSSQRAAPASIAPLSSRCCCCRRPRWTATRTPPPSSSTPCTPSPACSATTAAAAAGRHCRRRVPHEHSSGSASGTPSGARPLRVRRRPLGVQTRRRQCAHRCGG